jgi:integrase
LREKRKTLTAAAVRNLLPGKKRLEIPDAGCPGLRLIVQSTGHKSWALRFRRPDGRPSKLTLGPVDLLGTETPDEPVVGGPLTLAAARKLAADFQRQRAFGRDVIADHNTAKRRRRSEYADRTANAFGAAAKAFIEGHAKKTRSWATSARLLGLKPASLEPMKGGLAERWGAKPVAEITAHDLHELIDEIRAVGVPGLARRRQGPSDSVARVSLARLSKFFSWLMMERRLVEKNPCAGVWRPDSGPARERCLSDDEVRWFWLACGDLGEPFNNLIRLILLTGQRKNECAKMTWSELQGDLWHLPAERAKNGRAHVVPLSRLALEQIHGLQPVGTTYVFSTTGDVPVSGWSKVKYRLDARMAELARAEKASLPPWTIHDLRRTCATGLQRLGVRLEVTEAVLNHSSGSRAGIVGVYQRHQYGPEKRDALERWSAHVERIISG